MGEPKREQSGGRGGPSWGGVRCQTRGSEASDSMGLRAVLRLRHSVGMCRGSKFSEGLSTLLAPAPSIRITWEFYNHSRCSAQPEIQTQCLNICIFNKPPQAPLPQFISSAGDRSNYSPGGRGAADVFLEGRQSTFGALQDPGLHCGSSHGYCVNTWTLPGSKDTSPTKITRWTALGPPASLPSSGLEYLCIKKYFFHTF